MRAYRSFERFRLRYIARQPPARPISEKNKQIRETLYERAAERASLMKTCLVAPQMQFCVALNSPTNGHHEGKF